MATYNKRGYRPKVKSEKEAVDTLANEDLDSTTAEVFDTLDETANKTEEWVEKNQKTIIGVIGISLIAVLAFLAYNKFIAEPLEEEAAQELVVAQEFFNTALESSNTKLKDSIYNTALNGANGKYGLLEIIDNYGGTKAGNLAKYYAGMSYLATHDYKNAIAQLESFDSDDMIIGPLAKGAIGDAFNEINQPKDALSYYEKAIAANTNDFTTPRFLFKAGVTALKAGDKSTAAKHLSRLKDEFSKSEYATKAAVYLGQAQAK